MAKHTKQRIIERVCLICKARFTTGASIKMHCSPECRVKDAASAFAHTEGCWEWPGSRNPQTGYGQLSSWEDGKRRLYTAHRTSYRAFRGEIPAGLQVLHSCDNRPCFNPAHLFLGTHADNMRDMDEKGRRADFVPAAIHWTKLYPERIKRGAEHHLSKDSSCMPRGGRHHGAKLTDADIPAIRASTETLAVLSARYGVTQSALSCIRRRKTWTHVA
jgi:hypothetical protein